MVAVFDPKTQEYNKYERKYTDQADLVKYGAGLSFLYHVCGLDFEQFVKWLNIQFYKNNIRIPYIVEKVDTQTGAVLESTDPELSSDSDYTTLCDTLHLGIQGSDGIVVKFDGSYSGTIAQIRLITLLSFGITLLVAVILFGVIRVVVYQQKISEFRENFVRHMIHEIRNPIAYLKRALEFSASSNTDKNLRTASAKIGTINLLIEKLLSATSNKLDIDKRPVEIGRIFDDIRASYPDADLTTEIEPGLTPFRADPVHWVNALLNLVDNAIKYSPDRTRVSIRCFRDNELICVSVADRGIGIPPEYKSLIFDRYYRVPSKRSVPISGFGLGLSYVRMVAEAHGGAVTVRSTYKQGSEFTIRIPYDHQ